MTTEGADATTAQALIAKWREMATTHERPPVLEYYTDEECGMLLRCADELEAALAAVPSQGWQSIETAPTNERVLVFLPDTNANFISGVFTAVKIRLTGRWVSLGKVFPIEPIGWMPLPSPPRVAAGPEEPT